MTTDDVDNPYRRPAVDGGTELKDDARTPGLLEVIMIAVVSAIAGGFTFIGTCFGALISISVITSLLRIPAPGGRTNVVELSIVLAIYLVSTCVSGYFAYCTGRAIHRRLRKSRTSVDS